MISYKDDPEGAMEAVRIAMENAKKSYKKARPDFKKFGLDPDRLDKTGLLSQRLYEI